MNSQSYQEMGLADPPMTADEMVRFVLLALFVAAAAFAVGLSSERHAGAPAPQQPFTIRTMIA